MARIKIMDALAGTINATSDCIKVIPKIAKTFANKYNTQSKIEVAEDLQESSVAGNTAQEKATNVNSSCAALGWED